MERRYCIIDKMKRSSRGDDGSFFLTPPFPVLPRIPVPESLLRFPLPLLLRSVRQNSSLLRSEMCFLGSCTDLKNFRENVPVEFFGPYLHLKGWAELMNIAVSQLISFFVGLPWSPFDVSLQFVPLHKNRHFHEHSTGWVTGCHQLVQYRPVTPYCRSKWARSGLWCRVPSSGPGRNT